MIKKIIFSAVALTLLYGLYLLSGIWFDFSSFASFFKISLTYGILILIHGVVIGAVYVLREEGEMKDGDYLG